LHEITLGRDTRRELKRSGRTATLTVPDHEISRKHLSVRCQAAGWEVLDLGSKNGILVNGLAVTDSPLCDGDLIEAGGTLLMFREDGAAPELDADRDLATATSIPVAFRTVSAEFEQRISQLGKIARVGVPVLIRGETGTGK